MDKFPNMMNVTFIMNLNVSIAGITVCHLTIGVQSNYDPQSFQNCYSDWKILENIGKLPEFQINNSSEVSSTKLVPGLHTYHRKILTQLENNFMQNYCTKCFYLFANYHCRGKV